MPEVILWHSFSSTYTEST